MDPSMDDPMSDEELGDIDFDDDEEQPPGGVDVVEADEIAEEDVYAYDDPNDPLDRVLDVYLAEDLEDHLYLLQYPMRPADRPSSTPHAVKVKAANHLLEVEHAIKQGGKHFDKNAPPQLRQATQKHTGSRVRPATNFAFGVIRNNEFHLTPVHATMQMRPCFQHIDDAKALEIEMDLDDPENGGDKEVEKPQQVSYKKKESERATAARKSTYAYKKSIEDAEPWVALEVHGQNDQPSLDEFSRMFVEHEENGSVQGTLSKEFPTSGRYLQGLDYMEEYDENGESFSMGTRGRSQHDSIDLATAGASTYSPVKIPSAPLQQLGGDAKVIGYLKLAHLVPFSVLMDVTKMSAEAIMRTLSSEGRRKGLLVRGNWAARAVDVWSKGPAHAADCLSVAQVLLHRYGAVSRPDLQRRFPDLAPACLKEVLSNVADLDTIGRRWVPKLVDGIKFGIDYPVVAEIEEDRWAAEASNLQERLGDDIIAPPSCDTFEPFAKILMAATNANAHGFAYFPSSSSSPSGPPEYTPSTMPLSLSPAKLPALPPLPFLSNDTGSRESETQYRDTSGSAAESDRGPGLAPPGVTQSREGETKEGAVLAAATAARGTLSQAAPKRRFKPKKKGSTKVTGGAQEAKVKQEQQEAVGVEDSGGNGAVVPEASMFSNNDKDGSTRAGLAGTSVEATGSSGIPYAEDSAQTLRREGDDNGDMEGEEVPLREVVVPGKGRRTATTAAVGGSDKKASVAAVGNGNDTANGSESAASTATALAGLAAAKEEPRERDTESAAQDGEGSGLVAADGDGNEALFAEAGKQKSGSRARGKTKEEPAPRPKIRPRAPRAKPKGK